LQEINDFLAPAVFAIVGAFYPFSAFDEMKNFLYPFNSYTTIEFTLAERVPVSLVVSDISGKPIVTLMDYKIK